MEELSEVELLRQLLARETEKYRLLLEVVWQLYPTLPERGREILAHLFTDRKPADAIPSGGQVQEHGVG